MTATAVGAERRPQHSRRAPRAQKRFWAAGAATVVLLAMGLVASFPARQILAQRQETEAARAQLANLEADIDRLEARVEALNDPAEVKRQAREDHNLVEPGEESYQVTFPDGGPLPLPKGWPFLIREG
jgi:cell division protein FtsB